MKNYTCHKFELTDLGLLDLVPSNSLDYFEYEFIPIQNKLIFLKNRIANLLEKQNNIIFYIKDNSKIISIIVITLEDFDTSFFGIDMYKILYWLNLGDKSNLTKDYFSVFIKFLEYEVSSKKKKSYFLFSLNSNLSNAALMLTELPKIGFYYINTLLTFSMNRNTFKLTDKNSENKIKIRLVTDDDINAVMDLAKRSFMYSRFHMDPYLDKGKANELLATSAYNSITKGFADIMFVAEINEQVVGYYSGKKKIITEFGVTFGEAVISAVSEKHRGCGIFKELNQALLEWFYENTDFSEMGTYIVNTPIHRTWCKNGLTLVRGIYQLATILDP